MYYVSNNDKPSAEAVELKGTDKPTSTSACTTTSRIPAGGLVEALRDVRLTCGNTYEIPDYLQNLPHPPDLQ